MKEPDGIILGAEGSTRTMVHVYQIVQHYFPEDNHLNIHCQENLKTSYIYHAYGDGRTSDRTIFPCKTRLVV
jgi:hypothetical protein